MEKALARISNLPNNKAELTKFIRTLKDEILAADKEPLQILVQLKMIEKIIADTLKDEEIDLHFLKELEKYDSREEVKINGATLRQSEVGVKYDYNASGDIVWFDLDKQINDLTEKRKEREKFLQNIPYDKGIVDPEHGNFISRPPKHSKTKVIVKL